MFRLNCNYVIGTGVQDVDLRSLEAVRVNTNDPRLMTQRVAPVLDQDMRSLQIPPQPTEK